MPELIETNKEVLKELGGIDDKKLRTLSKNIEKNKEKIEKKLTKEAKSRGFSFKSALAYLMLGTVIGAGIGKTLNYVYQQPILPEYSEISLNSLGEIDYSPEIIALEQVVDYDKLYPIQGPMPSIFDIDPYRDSIRTACAPENMVRDQSGICEDYIKGICSYDDSLCKKIDKGLKIDPSVLIHQKLTSKEMIKPTELKFIKRDRDYINQDVINEVLEKYKDNKTIFQGDSIQRDWIYVTKDGYVLYGINDAIASMALGKDVHVKRYPVTYKEILEFQKSYPGFFR